MPAIQKSHLVLPQRVKHLPDRRATPRFLAEEGQVWLGRWVGHEFVAVACLVQNISAGGAAVFAPESIHPGSDVWISLPACPTGLQAVVVATEAIGADEHIVRLAFTTPCSPELLQAVVYGLETLHAIIN